MRNISFALTTEQVCKRIKTVTRRTGWGSLQPGTLLCAVRKGMGLRRGERVERLGTIRVVSVRRERLSRMVEDEAYGRSECAAEGFASDPVLSTPVEFVQWFAASHKCDASDEVTRIEFEYVDGV